MSPFKSLNCSMGVVRNWEIAITDPDGKKYIIDMQNKSRLGTWPVTRRQSHAASSTSRPVPSVSRSDGTFTHVADATKTVAPIKSSPSKTDEKFSKPSSPKQQIAPVHKYNTYFTITTNKGKGKKSPPIINVKISPIKFKESILK